jgi:hypothetical protein
MMRGEGATAGRRRVGLKIVVAIAAAVTAVAVGVGLRPGAGHPGSRATAAAEHRASGLASLPVAALGPVSAALGSSERSYLVRDNRGELTAANPRQALKMRFDRLATRLRIGGSTLSLTTLAAGYGNHLHALTSVPPSYRSNRVSYARGPLNEWYANGPMGLEQGFTLPQPRRGAGTDGPLTVAIGAGGDLHPRLTPTRHTIDFLTASGQLAMRYGSLAASDARGRALAAWLAVVGKRIEIRVDARGASFPVRIDPFIQGPKLVGTGATGTASEGSSVALSSDGSTAIVGSPGDTFGGSVLVFTRTGSSWSQQAKLHGSGEAGPAIQFGTSVAVSADGNTAVIGGPGDGFGAGAAWVFTRSGSTWTQQGPKLVANDGDSGSRQGSAVSVSADGNTALVGGFGDNDFIGAAWVFSRSASTWSQQGPKLVGTGSTGVPRQGASVGLSSDGNTAVIGGPADNTASAGVGLGAVWVFTRSGATWSQQGSKLVGAGNAGSANEGASVAVSSDGNTLLIGGPFDNAHAGATWVFTRSGTTWTQQGSKLIGSGAIGTARQGSDVDLSGDGNTAIIGGPGDNTGAGATWAFTRSGTTWSQQGSKLIGSGAVGSAAQGSGVAISADAATAIIGGPQDNASVGAAWVFSRSGSSWSQQGGKLVGSGETPAGVRQGSSVAASSDGGTLLVGGPADTHSRGAAWVFVRSGSTWIQQGSKLVGTGAVGQANEGASVALSADGNTALIGGPDDNDNNGAAWVFTRSGSAWSQQGSKLVGAGASANATQGFSVALSGDGNTALLGGPLDNNSRGAAWAFVRSGSTWSPQGPKLVGTGTGPGISQEGWSVALSADGMTALLGGRQDNGGTGATWVFVRSGSAWSQQGPKLVGSGGAAEGWSVALSANGSTALVGGPDSANSDGTTPGAAWIFTRSGSTWSQQGGKLVGTGVVGDLTEQGWSVALSGDGNTALIGGPGDANDPDNGTATGAAWLFKRTGSTWSQSGSKLVGSGRIGEPDQGTGVALSTDASTALVGGPTDNSFAGAVWVFNGPPHITSLSPTSGITGSVVRITGSGFIGTKIVQFGSLVAKFTVRSATQILATVPNGASTGQVSLRTASGLATSTQTFTPTLSITGLSPPSGPFGTLVTITGVGFNSSSTVAFNGISATNVAHDSSTQLKAVVPSAATTGPVTVTNSSTPTGTVQSASSYAVTPHIAPTITSFTPTSGLTGIPVTITGSHFSGASNVSFGTKAATFSILSDTQIRTTVPNGALAAKISVTTAAGTGASTSNFSPTLSITAFSPTSGTAGTTVTITGVGFNSSSTVKFHGLAASSVTHVSSTQLKATVPATTTGTTGPITVTNSLGAVGTVSSAQNFTVVPI